MSAVTHETSPENKNLEGTRKDRIKKVARSAGIIALIAHGPILGVAGGLVYSTGIEHRLHDAQKSVTEAVVTQNKNQHILDSYLGTKSESCAALIRAYLPGGGNAEFENGSATISLQESKVCSPTDVTALSTARAMAKNIEDATNNLHYDESSLADRKSATVVQEAMYGFAIGSAVFAAEFLVLALI